VSLICGEICLTERILHSLIAPGKLQKEYLNNSREHQELFNILVPIITFNEGFSRKVQKRIKENNKRESTVDFLRFEFLIHKVMVNNKFDLESTMELKNWIFPLLKAVTFIFSL
jgi:hypothetical protein